MFSILYMLLSLQLGIRNFTLAYQEARVNEFKLALSLQQCRMNVFTVNMIRFPFNY